jgi:hypothetical protein
VLIDELGLEGQLTAQDFLSQREALLDALFPTAQLMPGARRLVVSGAPAGRGGTAAAGQGTALLVAACEYRLQCLILGAATPRAAGVQPATPHRMARMPQWPRPAPPPPPTPGVINRRPPCTCPC